MAYTDYEYDKSAVLPANLITEYQVDLTDRGIFCEHGPFYQEGLVVEGWTGSAWVILTPAIDYTYSPGFLSVAAATGNWAYSYLVFMGDLNAYTKVRLTAQLVGGVEDRALLDMVATELNPSQRMYTYPWSTITTRYTMHENSYVPNTTSAGLLSVISSKLSDIAASLNTNQPDTDPNLLIRLQAVETALANMAE